MPLIQLIFGGVTLYEAEVATPSGGPVGPANPPPILPPVLPPAPAPSADGCPPGFRSTGTIFGGCERIPDQAPVQPQTGFTPGVSQERATAASILNPPRTPVPFRFPKEAGGSRFVSLLRTEKNTSMDNWSMAIDVAADDTTVGKLYPHEFIVTQGLSGAQASFVVMSLSRIEFDTSGPWSTPANVTSPLFFGVNDPDRVVPGYPTINLTTGRWYLNVHWTEPAPTAATRANGYNGNIDVDGYFG